MSFWSFNSLLAMLDRSATLKTNHNFKDQIGTLGDLKLTTNLNLEGPKPIIKVQDNTI
jgi:hypothetical protein